MEFKASSTAALVVRVHAVVVGRSDDERDGVDVDALLVVFAIATVNVGTTRPVARANESIRGPRDNIEKYFEGSY